MVVGRFLITATSVEFKQEPPTHSWLRVGTELLTICNSESLRQVEAVQILVELICDNALLIETTSVAFKQVGPMHKVLLFPFRQTWPTQMFDLRDLRLRTSVDERLF